MKPNVLSFLLFLICPQLIFAQWVQLYGPFGGTVNVLAQNTSYYFAGTGAGVFRLSKGTTSWAAANKGIENETVLALAANDSALFAGTPRSLLRSSDNGASWQSVPAPDGAAAIMVSNGTIVFAGANGGMYQSMNGGAAWTRIFSSTISFGVMLAHGKYLYAGCSSGLYRSTDNGATWGPRLLPGFDIRSLAVHDSEVVAGTRVNAVHRSTDNGASWTNIGLLTVILHVWPKDTVYHPTISALAFIPDTAGLNRVSLYARTQVGGFESLNRDSSWMAFSPEVEPYTTTSILSDNLSMLAATVEGGVYVLDMSQRAATWNWVKTNTGLAASEVFSIAGRGNTIFAASGAGGVQQSTDYGTSWNESNYGLGRDRISELVAIDSGLFALGDSASFYYDDIQHRWSKSWMAPYGWYNSGKPGIVGAGHFLYSWQDYDAPPRSDIVRSSVDSNWSIHINSGLPQISSSDNFSTARVYALSASDSLLLVSTARGLYGSVRSTVAWFPIDTSFSMQSNPPSIIAVGEDALARVYYVKVVGAAAFLTRDYGHTWEDISSGLPADVRTLTFRADGAGGAATIYAGTTSHGVFRYPLGKSYTSTIAPVPTSTPKSGIPFWINVVVGDTLAVSDLHSVSFTLRSNQAFCTYVDSSATYGPFLVDTVSFPHTSYLVPAIQWSKVDPQTVSMTVTKQRATGTSGEGVVAKAQFTTSASRSSLSPVLFSVSDVYALNSTNTPIYLRPGATSVMIYLGNPVVWPGDCNNDGIVSAADVLPLGLYFGRSRGGSNKYSTLWQPVSREYWPDEPPGKEVYADANGDGIVNSADLLMIGVNYGQTHVMTTNSMSLPSFAKASRVQRAPDGELLVTSVSRPPAEDGRVRVQIALKTSKPVYGVAFITKYGVQGSSGGAVTFIDIDTIHGALSGGLLLSRASDATGQADVGITRTDGKAFVGESALMDLLLSLPAGKESSLFVELCNVTGNDEKGNPVQLSGSVYRAGVTDVRQQVPVEFALEQNYPNPFNPSTTITYELPTSSFVTLKLFDVLGREVAVLVNEARVPGRYSVQWDGSALASGTYYCRIVVRENSGTIFSQTRRMMLMK